MRTIEIKLYQFDELTEEAKEKAREWFRDGYLHEDWWESTYEDAKNIGLKIDGFDLDRNKHATGGLMLSANEVAANIMRDHGDGCGTYELAEQFMEEYSPMLAKYMDEEDPEYESHCLEDDMQYLEDWFEKQLLEEYASMLQNEYEYLLSDENVDDTIIINEYEFNENGKRH
jgi:hypothetical protein